ncbi:hypothetical protein ABW16_08670 [Mycolicibacter heraklionensis]|uniref:Uncharacterized protein n=1 Tax=Mycolicibacter heraklionensis TaxID=512402 RepID=A0ABR5FH05_9MYCO|nr:hypothetical protein [Mycolicibacter heraklionensis]KLO29685.1 hypothetical protein ABW16_08670 [Mycolicibacter heraklionensis]
MTNPDGLPSTEAVPEADLAEQWIGADDDDEGLDPAAVENIAEVDANPADVIDQAISVPLPEDDYETGE